MKEDLSVIDNNEIKGHVKIEMIDENGNVCDTIENHNVVVDDATDLIAEALSDPAGYEEVDNTFQEDTDTISRSRHNEQYPSRNPLPFAKCERKKITVPLDDIQEAMQGAAKYVITLPSSYTPVDSIKNVRLLDSNGEAERILDADLNVYVKSSEKGTIGFLDNISDYEEDYSQIEFDLYQIKNRSVGIIPGSEEVSVAGIDYSLSTDEDIFGDRIAEDGTYGIDYKTGDIWFDSTMKGVTVKYKYKVNNGVNYMGIGDKPDNHTLGYPVTLTDDHTHLDGLRNEYEGARQPLKFPAKITRGSTETVARQGDGEQEKFYIPSNYTPVIEINEVTVYNQDGTPLNYEVVDRFTLKKDEDGNPIETKVTDSDGEPVMEEVLDEMGEPVMETVYDDDGEPVMEKVVDDDGNYKTEVIYDDDGEPLTVSVEEYEEDYEEEPEGEYLYDEDGEKKEVIVTEYVYEEKKEPKMQEKVRYEIDDNVRQVKLIDKGGESERAVLRFHPAPPTADMRNIRINFRWDSGATVNFVAEFDPFTPQPQEYTTMEAFTSEEGQTDFIVENEIIGIKKVLIEDQNVTHIADYDPNNIKRVELEGSPSPGSNVVIEYKYRQNIFDIYEVGLFNGFHEDSKMFSISGIGPVVKDENTGMRITWSITF